jgi:uncharacterized protein (DUF1697 family)
MARQIALLRGINLGKNKRLSMADLRELMHALGYEDAKTLLQSGNVVFTASERPGTVTRRIKARLARDAGIEADVLVRTRDEIAKIVARNPLREQVTDPKRYLVVFLSEKPDPKLLREIDTEQFEPERFHVHGREIYVWLPQGVQKARLTHAFWEKRLHLTATSRNWNTVEKLLAVADE